MKYRIYSNKRPYSNKPPALQFENKTYDYAHYMLIKKLL